MKKIVFLSVFVLFALVACDDSLQWSEKSPSPMNWDDAVEYCKNLNEGDHNDWKLPNIDELRTLIKAPETISGGKCQISEKAGKLSDQDWTEADCYVGVSKLGDTNIFWSSSVLSDKPDRAWELGFANGAMNSNYKYKSGNNYVRCVRNSSHSDSKQTATKSEDSKNKKETSETKKLQWSKIAPNEMNQKDAVKYCKNLNEDGHNDWKLPNIDELRTLIKDRKTVTGGKCKVSEKNACLSVIDCFNAEDCAEGCKPFYDEGDRTWVCKGECKEPDCKLGEGCYFDCNYTSSGGKYSKLGDTATFISSSIATQSEYGDQNFWTVNFNTGRITDEYAANVRCVRDTK